MRYLVFPLFLALLAALPVFHQKHAPQRGRDLALFFATDHYDTPSWRPLYAPVRDARALAADLYDLYGFDTSVVVNPSKDQVRTKLAEYAGRNYASDGQLLVFFSGHGQYIDLQKDGFYVPRDGKSSRDDPWGDSWLKYTDLRRTISGINCPHILLVVDACFSGALDEGIVFGSMGDEDEELDRPGEADAERAQRIRDLLRPRTRLFISSGKKDYVPDPSEFAAQFKVGLRSLGGKDGLLDVHNLYHSYLKKAASQPQLRSFEQDEKASSFLFDYRSRPKQQNPTATDRDGDGIPDARDGCPGEWAATPSGCPDSDEDGVPDKDDACPYEKGAPERQGCPAPPDRDNDGVPDVGDQCPDQAGPARFQGCPDSDGDGVPDHRDDCPTQKGLPAKNGCPDDPVPDFMVRIAGGTFEMGDQFGDGNSNEKPVHTVTVGDFYLGKTEVTVGEYLRFVQATKSHYPEWQEAGSTYNIQTGSNDFYKKLGSALTNEKHPIVGVSWLDAVAYCNWLSEQQGLTKVYRISGETVTADWNANGYRLPTEAEWEYAARSGGRKEKFAGFSDENQLYRYANFYDKSYSPSVSQNDGYKYTAPVGSYEPNGLKLYDMTGNVWEWCWDWYGSDYYGKSERTNPKGPSSGSYRVLRGGSWFNVPASLRASGRNYVTPSDRGGGGGFRLSRTALAGG